MTDFHPATKYMSAGVLYCSGDSVLLVNPVYKPRWEIPGGLVELDESPRAAAEREIREELGLALPIGRLLGIDYRAGTRFGEGLHFIFEGGPLDAATVATIRLDPAELSEHRFAAPDEITELAPPNLARRVLACLEASRSGAFRYMEDGRPLA